MVTLGALAVGFGIAAMIAETTWALLVPTIAARRPPPWSGVARSVSPYYPVLGNEPLAHGLRLADAWVVLAAVAVIASAGGILFARRDLS